MEQVTFRGFRAKAICSRRRARDPIVARRRAASTADMLRATRRTPVPIGQISTDAVGAARGRPAGSRSRREAADTTRYGHSHRPWSFTDQRRRNGAQPPSAAMFSLMVRLITLYTDAYTSIG